MKQVKRSEQKSRFETELFLSPPGLFFLVLSFLIITPLQAQQKLIFKDGSVEKVERYDVKGNRVRFKSTERNEWEEVPVELVDLVATRQRNEKEADELAHAPRGSLGKPGERPEKDAPPALKPSEPVQVSPGVKLPEAYGIYAWDGAKLVPLSEAGTRKRTDRKNAIINMVAPAPILKQKVSIQLEGATSTTKLRTASPVFYVHLPEERGGQISLFRMMVTKSARILKEVSHSQITGSDSEKSQEYIFTPALRLSENVYKIFPTKPLPEGEYCLLELTPQQNQLETTVWDFSIPK